MESGSSFYPDSGEKMGTTETKMYEKHTLCDNIEFVLSFLTLEQLKTIDDNNDNSIVCEIYEGVKAWENKITNALGIKHNGLEGFLWGGLYKWGIVQLFTPYRNKCMNMTEIQYARHIVSLRRGYQ